MNRFTLVAGAFVLLSGAANAESAGCAAVLQAGQQAVTVQIHQEDTTIPGPAPVHSLTCLSDFFSGRGLDIFSSLPSFSSLVNDLEGKLCTAVQQAWQSAIGSAQCGLTVSSYNLGFGLPGGGNFCPSLNIGGGGTQLLGLSGGLGNNGSGGFYLRGHTSVPDGY